MIMKKALNFYLRLIKNNTGISVKNFALFWGVVIAVSWTVIFLPIIIFVNQFFGKDVTINLIGLASLVGAIEAILAVLITFKVKSEKYEKPYTPTEEEIYE